MAFPALATVFAAMDDYPELYLDATNVLACFREEHRPTLQLFDQAGKLWETLMAGLARFRGRILFGTDHPAGMGAYADIVRDLDDLFGDDPLKHDLRSRAPQAFIERFLPGFDWGRRL